MSKINQYPTGTYSAIPSKKKTRGPGKKPKIKPFDYGSSSSWSTKDEMRAITFMGSNEVRSNGQLPTIKERKERVKNWLKTSELRHWDKKDSVDLGKCQNHARIMLMKLNVPDVY